MQESGAYAIGMRSTPPVELTEYFTCKSWGLPNGKGWLDEPVNYTKKISIAGNAYNALHGMTQSKNWVAWRKVNPELANLADTLMTQLDTV